jgi:SOS-response transcriptional repressor LexA
MKLKEAAHKLLEDFLASHRGNARAAADALGVNHVTFWGWVRGTRTPALRQISEVFERLGVEIRLPEHPEAATREVCFVDAKIVQAGAGAGAPEAQSYLAVPLVGEVGAGPGIIDRNEISSWVLVYQEHRSVMQRSDLLAVEIGKNQRSMIPTLHPGDIVLVDRGDWGQQGYAPPGNIFLVREPGQEGGGMVKRVAKAGRGELATLTFYSDNAVEYGPEVFHLHQYDHDLRRAVVGRVVWAWADLSRK